MAGDDDNEADTSSEDLGYMEGEDVELEGAERGAAMYESVKAENDLQQITSQHGSGRSTPRSVSSDDSTQSYQHWEESLDNLLEDRTGVELFQSYLTQLGRQDNLSFWFACKGFVNYWRVDHPASGRLAKEIHNKYVLNAELGIPKHTREVISRSIQRMEFDKHMFEVARVEMYGFIKNNLYPDFLRSEVYMRYVQQEQSRGCVPYVQQDRSSMPYVQTNKATTVQLLQSEQNSTTTYVQSDKSSSLPSVQYEQNRGSLPYVQSMQQVQQRTPTQHVQQASSMQHFQPCSSTQHIQQVSMSEPSMTADLTSRFSQMDLERRDVSRVPDGKEASKSSEGQHAQLQQAFTANTLARSSMRITKDEDHRRVMAETLRSRKNKPAILTNHVPPPINPREFAAVVTDKLKKLMYEEERADLPVDTPRNLAEPEEEEDSCTAKHSTKNNISNLMRIFVDRFKMGKNGEENYDEILDAHLSRVWQGSPPSQSPGKHSPEVARKTSAPRSSIHAKNKRDRDSPSYVPPFAYALENNKMKLAANQRAVKAVIPSPYAVSQATHVKPRKDSVVSADSGAFSMASSSSEGLRSQSPYFRGGTMQGSLTDESYKVRKDYTSTLSVDSGASSLASSQGVAPRRSLPGYPRVHRRDPEVWSYTQVPQQPAHQPLISRSPSIQDSSKTSSKKPAADHTVVCYYLRPENVPYRTKLPGHNVTLKQFKTIFSKKGNYRFFFKTSCDDLEGGVVKEEVSDNNEVLPLWEGKVVAEVESME